MKLWCGPHQYAKLASRKCGDVAFFTWNVISTNQIDCNEPNMRNQTWTFGFIFTSFKPRRQIMSDLIPGCLMFIDWQKIRIPDWITHHEESSWWIDSHEQRNQFVSFWLKWFAEYLLNDVWAVACSESGRVRREKLGVGWRWRQLEFGVLVNAGKRSSTADRIPNKSVTI